MKRFFEILQSIDIDFLILTSPFWALIGVTLWHFIKWLFI